MTTRIKPIYPISLMALLLTACSSDPVVQPEQPTVTEFPISFHNTELETQSNTRAVGLEEKGIRDFYVWGYKTKQKDGDNYTDLQTIMDQYKVQWMANTAGSTTTNGYDWEYVGITDHGQKQNIKYWDMLATSYRFFGIAPCSATVIEKRQQDDDYVIEFHADAADVASAPYISKLWITNNNPADFPSRKYRDVVTMEFMKPVTKVRIQLVDEQGRLIEDPGVEAGVTSLKFAPTGGGGVVQKGKLKVSYPLQGPITFTQYLPKLEVEGSTDGSLTMNRIAKVTEGEGNDYADWYYVLPHIKQDAFQLSLIVYGKTRMATVPQELMSWNPNMEYTYRFKLTASDVQFIDIVQIGVTEWTTEGSTHDIFNW